jgi:hypothetical protein
MKGIDKLKKKERNDNRMGKYMGWESNKREKGKDKDVKCIKLGENDFPCYF